MRKAQDQRYECFIGGEWVPPSTGDYAPNRNPADLDDVVGRA